MNREVKTGEARVPRRPRAKRPEATEELEPAREGERESEASDALLAVGRAIEEQVRARPIATLAAAAGAGFVLGNALHSRVGRIALLAAGGFAATRLLQGDGVMLLERLLGADIDDEDIEDELGDVEIGAPRSH